MGSRQELKAGRGLHWRTPRTIAWHVLGKLPGRRVANRAIWNGITTDRKSRKSKAPIPIIPKLAAKLEAHRARLENRKQGRSFPDFIAVNNVLVDKNCRGLIEGPQNIKLSPSSGPVGTVVTITGQNLGDMSSSASTVTFIDLSMSLTVVFHQ